MMNDVLIPASSVSDLHVAEEEKKETNSVEASPPDQLTTAQATTRKILESAGGVPSVAEVKAKHSEDDVYKDDEEGLLVSPPRLQPSTDRNRSIQEDDLLIPQLHHAFVVGSSSNNSTTSVEGKHPHEVNNVTADTAPSEASEFSPTYSDRMQGRVDGDHHRHHHRHHHHHPRRHDDEEYEEDEEDSSNDDSSYFADPSNLPSPKSGRHFSHSSISSLNNRSRTGSMSSLRGGDAANRESDASLSLSEDSEEEANDDDNDDNNEDRNNALPAQQPHYYPVDFPMHLQHPRGVPELFPHPITRMHSVSSLVSTSSQNSTDNEEELMDVVDGAEGEGGQRSSTTTTSDRPTPSGRKSPVLGQHPPPSRIVGPFFQSPTSNPSPPTIVVGAYPPMDYPHPQPHHLTTTNSNSDGSTTNNTAGQPFVVPSNSYDKDSPLSSVPSSTKGSKESMFTYSEDSEGHGYRHHPHYEAAAIAAAAAAATGGAPTSQTAQDVSSRGSSGGGGTDERSRKDALDSSSTHRNRGFAHAPYSKLSQNSSNNDPYGDDHQDQSNTNHHDGFKVYWQRWIMLMYMSLLNLLSDWTCYSVAPIAVLTREAFGSVNAERLVVVFLGANALATASEPIILSRLGLRRTVLFGALLLMMGSIIKSGGMPPIIQAKLEKGEGEWRVYLGFFLVGLSQPLYQCTPALLSASWFPERERTLATGVALNANQVGIGFAFIFGTLLVSTSDDIPAYFGLLSIVSTLIFIGVLVQFDDAPPTPPSDTAKVIRGTLDVGLPNIGNLFNSVRNFGSPQVQMDNSDRSSGEKNTGLRSNASTPDSNNKKSKSKSKRTTSRSSSGRSSSSGRRHPTSSGNSTRRRTSRPTSAGSNEEIGFHGLAPAPSPIVYGAVGGRSSDDPKFIAPSPMMPGHVASGTDGSDENPSAGQLPEESAGQIHSSGNANLDAVPSNPFLPPGQVMQGPQPRPYPNVSFPPGAPTPFGYVPQYGSTDDERYGYGYGGGPPYPGPPQAFSQPVWDPYYQQYVYFALPPVNAYQPANPYYYSYQNLPPPVHPRYFDSTDSARTAPIDIGAEPVLTITPHHLDIDIRDDQILLSIRACLSRPGFIHALVAFTVSGIVINTLSTFMDYLVRLNGAGREYTGIVGGSFQFVIMISSLLIGQFTDKTRAYYSVAVGMLVLGAFGLAECGVNLDSDRGVELRWSLIVVAALVGPLQPVSTELGVDVVYPLSENTVLVIQQLFANLLSALFIPCFKAFKNFGIRSAGEGASEQPEYTFSFYVLIVIHAAATVFFATFNGRYVRYEHELEKQAQKERRESLNDSSSFYGPPDGFQASHPGTRDQEPLIPPIV